MKEINIEWSKGECKVPIITSQYGCTLEEITRCYNLFMTAKPTKAQFIIKEGEPMTGSFDYSLPIQFVTKQK